MTSAATWPLALPWPTFFNVVTQLLTISLYHFPFDNLSITLFYLNLTNSSPLRLCNFSTYLFTITLLKHSPLNGSPLLSGPSAAESNFCKRRIAQCRLAAGGGCMYCRPYCVLLHYCSAASLYWCIGVLLYNCTAVILYSCITFLLYYFTDVLL